jgi:hypothetical protein
MPSKVEIEFNIDRDIVVKDVIFGKIDNLDKVLFPWFTWLIFPKEAPQVALALRLNVHGYNSILFSWTSKGVYPL